MKAYLNHNFILGIVLLVLGVIALLRQDAFFLVDFILGIVNLFIFFAEKKKKE